MCGSEQQRGRAMAQEGSQQDRQKGVRLGQAGGVSSREGRHGCRGSVASTASALPGEPPHHTNTAQFNPAVGVKFCGEEPNQKSFLVS